MYLTLKNVIAATTTDQSISPVSTSSGSPTDSISTDDVEDYEIDDTRNLSQLKNSGNFELLISLSKELKFV